MSNRIYHPNGSLRDLAGQRFDYVFTTEEVDAAMNQQERWNYSDFRSFWRTLVRDKRIIERFSPLPRRFAARVPMSEWNIHP